MQFLRFPPECSGLWLKFGHSTNCHSQEMFYLTRFLPTRADVLQEFLFRNGVVSFDIVCTDTTRSTDELTDQPICHSILWNSLREIDYRFAESRGPLL